MNNIIKQKRIAKVLSDKFNKKIHLTKILGGKDKDAYLATFDSNEKIIILTDKKNSISRNYRSLQSNYLQKDLYKQGEYVADVIDIFEKDEIGIISCHQYLEGKQMPFLNNYTAKLCGISIAKFHCGNIHIKYYFSKFSYSYVFYGLVKIMCVFLRNITNIIGDRNWLKLKKGICHRDLNLNNFIFMKNSAYLIDFDRARYWPYVYEIERFFRNENSKEYIKEFIIGYESVRKLDKFEQQYLIDRFEELKKIF